MCGEQSQSLDVCSVDGLGTCQQANLARLIRMSPHVDHLIDQALALAPAERSAVAIALLDSLDFEVEGIAAAAWAEEMRARKSELRSGVASAIPWKEAKARLVAL